MLRHPLEAIRCLALDVNCKSKAFSLSHKSCSACACNLSNVLHLYPLSGEYALAEYTEVKAVTIKLSETS